MLSVVMLRTIILSILMYSVVILCAVMLAVAAPQNQFPENEPRFFFILLPFRFWQTARIAKKWG